DRLAECDPDVLGRVVVVDMEVADRLHREVDAGMPGEQIEHMVEEADPGRNIGYAGAIEVHRNLDVGFLGLAFDAGRTHGKSLSRLHLVSRIQKTGTRSSG